MCVCVCVCTYVSGHSEKSREIPTVKIFYNPFSPQNPVPPVSEEQSTRSVVLNSLYIKIQLPKHNPRNSDSVGLEWCPVIDNFYLTLQIILLYMKG